MNLLTLFARLPKTPHAVGPFRNRRLECEQLESRDTPSGLSTWDGGGTTNSFNEAANWVGNVAPAAGNRLVFPAGVSKTTVDFTGTSGYVWSGITFRAGYTLTGNTGTLYTPSVIATAGATTIGFQIGTNYYLTPLTVNTSTATASLEVAGISSAGTLTKVGPGTMTCGTSTISGPTLINAGTMVASGTRLGSVVMVNPRGQLHLRDTVGTFTSSLIVNSANGMRNLGGANTLSGSVVLTGTSRFHVGAGQLTVSGYVSGPYGLVKSGIGVLTLTANNSYQGITVVSEGVLRATNHYALGSTVAGTYVNSLGTLEFNGGSTSLSVYESLALVGGLVSAGASNTLAGPVGLVSYNPTIPIDTQSQLTVSNVISGKCNTLAKMGAGTLIVSAKNTYSGSILAKEGVIRLQNSAGLGAAGNPVQVLDGASLELTGGITPTNPLAIEGAGADSLGALRSLNGSNNWMGTIVFTDAATLGVDAGDLVIYGAIKQVAGVVADLNKVGAGGLWLVNANLYSGTTQVSEGRLLVGHNSALGTGLDGVVVHESARLGLYRAGPYAMPLILANNAVLDVFANSIWNGPVILTATSSARITTNGTSQLTINGPLMPTTSSTGPMLYKDGAGTLVLNGPSTLGNSITVLAGTLESNGIVSGGAFQVTGRLSGKGVHYNPLVIYANGSLRPGDVTGQGILTAVNSVTLSTGSTYVAVLKLNSQGQAQSNLLYLASGSISIYGSLTLNVTGVIPVGTKLTIIRKDSSGAVYGTFSGLPEGTTFTDPVSGQKFRISYVGGDGNDVVLTRVA